MAVAFSNSSPRHSRRLTQHVLNTNMSLIHHTTTRHRRAVRPPRPAPGLRHLKKLMSCAQATPLPHNSPLHAWIDDSIQRVRDAAPGDKYQTELEPLLPSAADSFFSFCSDAEPSTTTKLQKTLNAKANTHIIKAAVQSLKERAKDGDMWERAHQRATSAPNAWVWKVVRPEKNSRRVLS